MLIDFTVAACCAQSWTTKFSIWLWGFLRPIFAIPKLAINILQIWAFRLAMSGFAGSFYHVPESGCQCPTRPFEIEPQAWCSCSECAYHGLNCAWALYKTATSSKRDWNCGARDVNVSDCDLFNLFDFWRWAMIGYEYRNSLQCVAIHESHSIATKS